MVASDDPIAIVHGAESPPRDPNAAPITPTNALVESPVDKRRNGVPTAAPVEGSGDERRNGVPTTAPAASSGGERRSVERVARVAIGGLALLGVLLLFGVSRNRAYQIDEVEHLHAAYHVRSGRSLYAEVWQVHMPLLYGALAPLVDTADPPETYARARALLLLDLLAVTLFTALGAARAALPFGRDASRLAGALAASLLLLHTTFIERGMEVRPDGPLALCVAVALWLELGGSKGAGPRGFAAGVVLGLGFLLTQKAVFATAAFGLWWLWRAVRSRRTTGLLLPAAGWMIPVALAFSVIAVQGAFDAFWRDAILGAASAAGRDAERLAFSPADFLVQESLRNVAFSVLAVASLAGALWVALRTRAAAGETPLAHALALPVFLALVLFGTLWLQPFPWPYVHVGVLPPVAVVAAAASARALAGLPVRSRWVAWPAAALLVACQAVTAVPRLVAKSLPQEGAGGSRHQLALLDEVQRVTADDDAVFDLAGLYFRPDGYPAYALSGDLYRLYRAGGLPPMVPALRERGTVAFVYNYRVGWLRGEEREFLQERFAHHTSNLFLLGRELGGLAVGVDVPFEVLRRKPFRYDGPPNALLVDGQPFARGDLDRGVHILRLTHAVEDARLILDTPEPRPPRVPPVALYVHFD